MSGHYCEITNKTYTFAYDDQAVTMACKVFNLSEDQLSALTGKYVKGKNKGKLKGQLAYKEIVTGGWYRYNQPELHNDTGYVACKCKFDFRLESLVYSPYGYIPDEVLARAGSSIPLSLDDAGSVD